MVVSLREIQQFEIINRAREAIFVFIPAGTPRSPPRNNLSDTFPPTGKIIASKRATYEILNLVLGDDRDDRNSS